MELLGAYSSRLTPAYYQQLATYFRAAWFAQLGTAQTTSFSSRSRFCHFPDPLPANRQETSLTPVGSGLCAWFPALRMDPVLCPDLSLL